MLTIHRLFILLRVLARNVRGNKQTNSVWANQDRWSSCDSIEIGTG